MSSESVLDHSEENGLLSRLGFLEVGFGAMQGFSGYPRASAVQRYPVFWYSAVQGLFPQPR